MYDTTAAGCLVKHIGVQEIARFGLGVIRSITLFSKTVDKVAFVWIGIIQSRSHEIVGFLGSGIRVGIIVANCPVVEGITIRSSATVCNTVEADGSPIDHVMIVSTISAWEFILKARVEGGNNRYSVVV